LFIEIIKNKDYNSTIMDILAKLFGGQSRVRIMRFFLLNDGVFDIDDIASRTRITKPNIRKELNILLSLDFIRSKVSVKTGSRGAKKKVNGWYLNSLFKFLHPIKDLLVDPSLFSEEDLIQKFKRIGKIKLLIISGIFLGDNDGRVDLLFVGDKLKKNVLQQIVKGLEADIGRELNYVIFDSEEFKYRLDMYDKLVCDIIDLPHEKLIDNGQLSVYISKR